MKALVFLVRLLAWFTTVGVAYQWGRGLIDVFGVTALVLFFIANTIHLMVEWRK